MRAVAVRQKADHTWLTAIGRVEIEAANPDGDGTLDFEEYMALIEKLSKEANPDNNGTLDEAEFEAQVSNCSLSSLDELLGKRYIESK